jgi:hypothetical protein
MKKLLSLFLVVAAFTSCNNDDDALTPQEVLLIGNWKLIEFLADPGDGNGTFQTITSDKTVTFNSNEEITSNYSLCNMSITNPQASNGTYSTTTGIIDVLNCTNNSPLTINFELLSEGSLIINYPCIEACQEKYVKIE